MKSKGFLDEIEELVDEVWDQEKKQINNHVDYYQKVKQEEYKELYIKHMQDQRMWDSPYSSTYITKPQVRPIRTVTHKCGCNAEIEVSFLDIQDEFRAIHAYGEMAGRPVEMRRPDTERFHCPRCRQETFVVGKIIEIKVNMTE